MNLSGLSNLAALINTPKVQQESRRKANVKAKRRSRNKMAKATRKTQR